MFQQISVFKLVKTKDLSKLNQTCLDLFKLDQTCLNLYKLDQTCLSLWTHYLMSGNDRKLSQMTNDCFLKID